MEVSGTILRQSVSFSRGAGDISSLSGKARVRVRQKASVGLKPWSDESHRLYYAAVPRCCAVRDAKKYEKAGAASVAELSRELAVLYSTSLGIDGGEVIGNSEVKGDFIKVASALLAQLKQQKANAKAEMKRRKKEEKAAALLKTVEKSSSSSSSSSESGSDSDSDCCKQTPEESLPEVTKEQSLSAEFGAAAIAAAAAVKRLDNKIEVCMGGKCRKGGSMELLQELERKVCVEGAVVGCKCMGRCKEGPNVRLSYALNNNNNNMKLPLCRTAVGLQDVTTIVSEFLAQNKSYTLDLMMAPSS